MVDDVDSDFNAKAYWDNRLEDFWNLEGVGYIGMGAEFNDALYRVKGNVFRRVVKGLPVNVQDSQVLDIGSGVGFVISQWERLGANEIVGSDITKTAVEKLGELYPRNKYYELDVGGNVSQLLEAEDQFDLISALDVLYHIVDDDLYQNALKNIASLMRPGGYFLLADNFIHGQEIRGRHQVSHSLETLDSWLKSAGFVIERRVPQYVLMNMPVDSESKWLHRWWSWLSRRVKMGPRHARVICNSLLPLELLLTHVLNEGPSTELAVCRKL